MGRVSQRDRGLLAESHLEEFVRWAESRGWKKVPTKGRYEVLRLVRKQRRRGDAPAIYHQRLSATQHVTSWGVGLDLAKSFVDSVIRPRKRQRSEQTREP